MHKPGRLAVVLFLVTTFPSINEAAPEGGSGWSLSVGVQTRQVDVGFQIDAPSPVNPANFFSPRRSR